MRNLKIIQHISLDGVIQSGGDTDGGFSYGDWGAPYRSPEGLRVVLAMYGEKCDLLVGRRTYEHWSEYWPDAPASPMADRMNAATKYVFTHRPESLKWGPFKAIGTDIVSSVLAVKATKGPDLICAGSSTLTSTLLEQGLADELVLMVNPILLGKGKRIFAEGTPPRSFVLESSKAMPSGIIVNHYKADGTLRNLR